MKLKIESRDVNASNLIAIGQEDGKTFCVVDPGTTLDVAFQMLHTLSLHLLNSYTIAANGGQLPKNPTEEQSKKFIAIKEQLYDMYNIAVSSVLEHYAPEFELRPDITADAIAKEEEKIVKEKYSHLSPSEKQQAHRNIQKFKKDLLIQKSRSKAKTPEEIKADATKQVSEV